jgi:outer membrane receptor protein involved in Fe transport
MTFTDATFRTAVSSTKLDEANIFTGAQQGNEVPNIPQVQFAVGTSFIFDKLTVNLDGQYVGETFGTGNNATNNTDLNGNKDVRYGKTDSVFLLDLGLSYKVNPKVKLFTNLRNVTNEVYLASRLPHGVRGGAPFQAFGGMEINF